MYVSAMAPYPDGCDHDTFLYDYGVYSRKEAALDVCDGLKKLLTERRDKEYAAHMSRSAKYHNEDIAQDIWDKHTQWEYDGEYRVVEIELY